MVRAERPGVKIKKSPYMINNLQDRQYTLDEVATIFEVSIQTVRVWIRNPEKSGLVATKATGRKSYQVSRAAMSAFAVKRYMS